MEQIAKMEEEIATLKRKNEELQGNLTTKTNEATELAKKVFDFNCTPSKFVTIKLDIT